MTSIDHLKMSITELGVDSSSDEDGEVALNEFLEDQKKDLNKTDDEDDHNSKSGNRKIKEKISASDSDENEDVTGIWRALWKEGVWIRGGASDHSVLLGMIRKGGVILAVEKKDRWIRHNRGWSPISDERKEFTYMRRLTHDPQLTLSEEDLGSSLSVRSLHSPMRSLLHLKPSSPPTSPEGTGFFGEDSFFAETTEAALQAANEAKKTSSPKKSDGLPHVGKLLWEKAGTNVYEGNNEIMQAREVTPVGLPKDVGLALMPSPSLNMTESETEEPFFRAQMGAGETQRELMERMKKEFIERMTSNFEEPQIIYDSRAKWPLAPRNFNETNPDT
ncbi:hypothetical protein AAMO2058_001755500, partial [Amorphochlora amoebiformis]